MRIILFGIIFVLGLGFGLLTRQAMVYGQLNQIAKNSSSYVPVSQNPQGGFGQQGGGSCGG